MDWIRKNRGRIFFACTPLFLLSGLAGLTFEHFEARCHPTCHRGIPAAAEGSKLLFRFSCYALLVGGWTALRDEQLAESSDA